MTEWGVLLAGLVVLDLIALVLNTFVNPSKKREIDTVKVIQHNTDAINNLTTKIDALTISNSKDHDHFHSSINRLNQDVAILQEKHRND